MTLIAPHVQAEVATSAWDGPWLWWWSERVSPQRIHGLAAVASVVGRVRAPDGHAWVLVTNRETWFEVIGDVTGLGVAVEVSTEDGPRLVRRTGERGDLNLLPPQCHEWMTDAWDSELWSAADATAIGWLWIQEGTLAPGTTLVPPRQWTNRT